MVSLNLLQVAGRTYNIIREIFLIVPNCYRLPFVLLRIIVREEHGCSIGLMGKKIDGYPDITIEILATSIGGFECKNN